MLTPTKRKLVETGAALRLDGPAELDFLHTVLTQAGLPYRDPGDAVRVWSRRQGAVSLRVEAGAVADPATGDFREVGLPWGEKARLVLIHLTGEALRTGSPVIDVEGSLTAYVRELGLPTDGRTIRSVKEQLGRLSAATIRLAHTADGHAVQVNASLVAGLDLWAPLDPCQRVLWPSRVELSAAYFASIQSHAVPLARPAVRALAHSALALDAYAWLAQRLHRVRSGKPQAVSWDALKMQFGMGYARLTDFKRKFREALASALTVYPGARVEETEDGLLLHHSRPPVPKRTAPRERLAPPG